MYVLYYNMNVYYIYNKERRNEMKKYRVYDNNTNELIMESDDKFDINVFLMTNTSGDIYTFHNEGEYFIMWFECYTVYIKM